MCDCQFADRHGHTDAYTHKHTLTQAKKDQQVLCTCVSEFDIIFFDSDTWKSIRGRSDTCKCSSSGQRCYALHTAWRAWKVCHYQTSDLCVFIQLSFILIFLLPGKGLPTLNGTNEWSFIRAIYSNYVRYDSSLESKNHDCCVHSKSERA